MWGGQRYMGTLLAAQFCCEPKTALKNKSCEFILKGCEQ